jgi:hypothetical protein
MPSLAASIRHATRTLLRNRGYTTAAVVTLGLGLGATASIYTLVQRVVLDPSGWWSDGRLDSRSWDSLPA